MYGLEVSCAKISLITDKLLPLITEWRNRPLESVYPIVFLDAMHFKVRVDGKVVTKAFYSVLAVSTEGKKYILGLYLSENEIDLLCLSKSTGKMESTHAQLGTDHLSASNIFRRST